VTVTADIKIKDPAALTATIEDFDSLAGRLLAQIAHDRGTLAEIDREDATFAGPEDTAEALAAAHAHTAAQKAMLTASIAGATAQAERLAALIAEMKSWQGVITAIQHDGAGRIYTI
jgi:hypothetical protein